jgi:hypothetical protein
MLTKTAFYVVFYVASIAVIGVTAEKWEDLRVTFGVVPIEGQGKNEIPRVVSDATNEGWVTISKDCSNGGKFNGLRYLYQGDSGILYDRVVLYDTQGTVAGLQMLLPQSAVLSAKSTIHLGKILLYQNDTLNGVDYFVLTAYFQNPDTICTVGRSKAQLESDGTGDGLWLQSGVSPVKTIEVPLTRDEAIDDGWSENACFPQMGFHNFYRLDTWDSTNCEEIRPVFLLFNHDDELHGFGFVSPGKVTSDYFENPPYLAIKAIANPKTPECLKELADNGITSMHVYFRSRTSPFACYPWDFWDSDE